MSSKTREYRYPKLMIVYGVLVLLWGTAMMSVMMKPAGEWLVSDLSYLRLWPPWMRYGLLALLSMWNAIGLLCAVAGLWLLAVSVRMRHQRVILDDTGIRLAERGFEKEFSWTRVSICSQHAFAVWVSAGEDGFWIWRMLVGFHEMKDEVTKRASGPHQG